VAAERRAVRDAVTRLRLVPVMFGLGARPHPPCEVYRAYLAQSQVFIGIYWQRYGWVAPGKQISGLEDEYLLSALRAGSPVLRMPGTSLRSVTGRRKGPGVLVELRAVEQQYRAVLEVLDEGAPVTEVARRYRVAPVAWSTAKPVAS
jgi:Domain of unknown function (DUF4062)